MRRISTFLLSPSLLARVVGALFVTWLLFWAPFSRETPPAAPVTLEAAIGTPQEGSLSLRIDAGHGFATHRPATIGRKLPPSAPAPVSLPLPVGQVRALRLSFFSTQ